MSSLDEILLFSSAALCTIKRSSETRYGFIYSLFVQLRREAGRNFMSGYYKPETLPYMYACRDAAVAGSMAAGVRRQCDFGISRYVPDEVEPLVSPSMSGCRNVHGTWSSPACPCMRPGRSWCSG